MEDNVALAITRIALIDPGHPSISEFREAAREALAPVGKRALAAKEWGEAARAFRDLLAVVPDDETAHDGLVKALSRLGWQRRRQGEHGTALEHADELLNLEPESFSGLRLRAESLSSLERYEEAVTAFRAAMRVRPKHKETRRGYWRARAKVTDEPQR